MGIGQLEDLYRLILISFENIDSPVQDTDWRASQLCGFQHAMGTIIVLDEPLTILQIIALLADIPEDKFDVTNFLQRFRTRSCLEVIVKEAGRQSDVVVKYSVQYWYQHLRKAVEGGAICEDERIWNLFEHMVEEAVVDIWATTYLMGLFVAVAAAGWGLVEGEIKI
ncbi:hypothetical protein B0H14DRAFT_3145522 [Mycena olivaceomarginata]|nr:hypothetical protein B0H14DRAFT_3145522 [Mycena olivaceomarginata]